MTKEWNGEGLPPVGCECWFDPSNDQNSDASNWITVTIVAHHNGKAIFCDYFSRHYYAESEGFHPVKSKQEIERDKAIDEMHNEFKFQGVAQLPKRASLELLYDNGYRKQGKEVSKAELASFISKVHGLEYLHSELHEYFTIAHKE